MQVEHLRSINWGENRREKKKKKNWQDYSHRFSETEWSSWIHIACAYWRKNWFYFLLLKIKLAQKMEFNNQNDIFRVYKLSGHFSNKNQRKHIQRKYGFMQENVLNNWAKCENYNTSSLVLLVGWTMMNLW